ncbi:MAG: CHAT domain-containing protein [Anaerolineae bacterium]|jgi:tetratricopeptide (TPR) repeat protein
MPDKLVKPVILLTFANDLDDRVRYLRHLSEEARRLRRALEDADRAGRCKMEIRQNATLDDMLGAFQGFRNRVVIFHYGGHAGSLELLVETPDGRPARAHAAGLAAFLAQQRGLLLVFLNGCSTQPQVQGLLEAGVSAVIATAQSIDDGVATEFAGRFYQGLASGATLAEAFEEAVGAVRSAHGDNPRHLYTSEEFDEDDADTSRWPWELTVGPGAEEALEWCLPEAAEGRSAGAERGPTMEIHGPATFEREVVFGNYIRDSTIGPSTSQPEPDQDAAGPGAQAAGDRRADREPDHDAPQATEDEDEQGKIVRPPPRAALQWFVDRERERERFDNMLTGSDTTRVLAVSGPEGIGKTWLRKRLSAEARQRQTPAFAFEFAPGEAFYELSLLQQAALALGGQQFPRLWGMLEEAAHQKVLIKVDAAAPSGGLTVHGDAEIQQLVEGPVFEGNTFIFPHKTPDEWRLWSPRITEAFFQDLAHLGQTQGAALLFDSYEVATGEAQDWIEKKLLQCVCEDRVGQVWVVLVGEEVPYLSADWGGLVAELSLDPWSAAIVREYLPKRCVAIGEASVPSLDPQQQPDGTCDDYVIIGEESVSVIFRETGGRPDQIALLADFRQELQEPLDEGQVHEILARGIVNKTKGPVREALRQVTLAEWFDVELLAALIKKPEQADERLGELRAYSFVQEAGRGRYRLAPRARQVLTATWERQPQQLAEVHGLLARHLEERAAGEEDPWLRRELRRQAMGHRLAADEDVGRQRMCVLFEEAEQGHWLSECELLIKRAQAIPTLSALTQAWLEYLQGRLALARRDRKTASKRFKAVRQSVATGSELYGLAEWSLGQLAAEGGNWSDATERYEESLQTFTAQKDEARQGQVMLSLGELHLNQAEALGGPMQPWLLEGGGGRPWLRALPAAVVALPFVVYARAIQRWRLPPLQYGMSYSNWTLARLLLTARQWFNQAAASLASAGGEDLIPEVQRKLAQTYHLLGWERDAQRLFKQLLSSGPVSSSEYRKAQVRKDLAETDLSARDVDSAVGKLKECLQTFEEHKDRQAQAKTHALLGRAYLEQGDVKQGVAHMREGLAGFARLGDQLGAGPALHTLRGWLERSRPTGEQADEARALLAETEDKVYFPRVADQSAQTMEVIASAGLLVLLVLGLVMVGVGLLTPVGEILRAGTLLRLVGWLLVSAWIFFGTLGGLGLLLILRGARRNQKPEPLDRIVTSQDAIRRFDYRDKEQECIPWDEIQAIVSVDRVLWRAPLALLSQFEIIGREARLRVPATVRWYGALRQDVEDHLRELGATPDRLRLDVRLPLGVALLVSLVLIVVGGLVVYAVIPLPISPEAVAWVGTTLLFLGVMALLVGSTWWLVIHPLCVRYHQAPRSWLPLAAGLAGLGIAALAWWLRWRHPFYPIRNWLEWTVHPLGYMLLVMAPLWVLTARHRSVLGAERSGPAYSTWLRATAVPVLLVAAALAGLFVRNEWLPYWPLWRALACYQRNAYDCTVQSANRALAINSDMADGYNLRAAALMREGEYRAAVDDLSHLIDSRSAIVAEYYLRRARAYKALADVDAACADLRAALALRRWGLSAGERGQAETAWEAWECSGTSNQGKE